MILKPKIDEQIANSVNAEVNFDLNKFQISLLRYFPNLSVSAQDFSIVGKDEFAGDTLVALDDFSVTVDLWSAIFGSEIKVRGVYLTRPRVFAKVLSNGKANWDIAKSTPEDTVQLDEENSSTDFNVSIRRWESYRWTNCL